MCSDDILHQFWEIEESLLSSPALTVKERFVVEHFKTNHTRTSTGRLIVPLPRRPDAKLIESRSHAVHKSIILEHSLYCKNRFQEVDAVVQEYLTLGHAAVVPIEDTNKAPSAVFHLPLHVVYKNTCSTT